MPYKKTLARRSSACTAPCTSNSRWLSTPRATTAWLTSSSRPRPCVSGTTWSWRRGSHQSSTTFGGMAHMLTLVVTVAALRAKVRARAPVPPMAAT